MSKTGLAGSPHHNWDRHVRMAAETTWGTVAGEPSWTPVPILGDGFKLQADKLTYMADSNIGKTFKRSVAVPYAMDVQGDHTLLAWPGVVNAILAAALTRDASNDLTPQSLDFRTPVETRRFLGCLAATLNIRATGTGDNDLQLVVGWRARSETVISALALNKSVPLLIRKPLYLASLCH